MKHIKKLMKLSKVKLIVLIIVLIAISLAIFFGVSILSKASIANAKPILLSNLIGEDNINLNVGESYIESGIKFTVDGVDKSKDIVITNDINNTVLGKYTITYKYNEKVIKTRTINIVDTVAPELTLNGDATIKIIQTTNYNEPGYSAIDNYDKDITSKVVVTGSVNIKTVGAYILKYSITDSSGNVTEKERTINVVAKPKTIVKVVENKANSKDTLPVKQVATAGLVTNMKFTSNGVSINGCAAANDTPLKIALNDTEYDITATNNCYSGTLDLSSLVNGDYDFNLKSTNGTNKIVDTLDPIYQIKRAKVGNKLVTFDYTNNNIKVTVVDFSYDYDILIDVGHGGWDSGATNIYALEKNINLEVSNYEKARYESMGISVKLSRTDDTYGMVMGSTDWLSVRRRSYAVGYYGVTARYVYSNHHNSDSNTNNYGVEMLIPASKSNVSVESKIANGLSGVLKYNAVRMYTKDYDTNIIYNKSGGEVYNFTNWYAMNRIPYELFNTYVTIYEGCYMSNVDEFLWYYTDQNWKKVSEVKIKAYVEALGKTYVAP